MTASDARRTLDFYEALIKKNVDDLYAGRVTDDEFRTINRMAHDEIARAGQTDKMLRRWRREHAAA